MIWKKGELEQLPIRDGAVDVAMLSQALHHAHDPARAVAEAARITAPGGRVLLLDLARTPGRMGPRQARRSPPRLRRRGAEADADGGGTGDVKVGVGARKAGDPFTVLIAAGRKAAPKADEKRTHDEREAEHR